MQFGDAGGGEGDARSPGRTAGRAQCGDEQQAVDGREPDVKVAEQDGDREREDEGQDRDRRERDRGRPARPAQAARDEDGSAGRRGGRGHAPSQEHRARREAGEQPHHLGDGWRIRVEEALRTDDGAADEGRVVR